MCVYFILSYSVKFRSILSLCPPMDRTGFSFQSPLRWTGLPAMASVVKALGRHESFVGL